MSAGFAHHPVAARRGFTLLEAAVCTLIVGLTLVAAVSTVGAARRSHKVVADKALARLLAADLLAEIISRPYADPDGSTKIGIDGGESPSSRASFDDVDDYHGLRESPPRNPDGAAIPGAEHLIRIVSVEYVGVLTPNQVSSSDTGAKRITVTIAASSGTVATRIAIRTRAADVGGGGVNSSSSTPVSPP